VTTGILVGLGQIDSAYSHESHDCVLGSRCRSNKINYEKAEDWNAVPPPMLDHHNLPKLYALDKAILVLNHTVIAVRKHYMMSAKVRATVINHADE